MPKKELPIDKLRIDHGLQARVKTDPQVVTDYADRMSDGEQFPPVVAFHDGETYWLADGFHTVAAAVQAAFGVVLTDVRDGLRLDALRHAVGANAAHGLQRTNADKRRAVELCIAEPELAKLSTRAIAELCRVGCDLVNRITRELSDAGNSGARARTSTKTRTGTDGKQHPARKSTVPATPDVPEPETTPQPESSRQDVIRNMVPLKSETPNRHNPTRFQEAFGVLVREADALAEATGILNAPQHVKFHTQAEVLYATYQEWSARAA